MIDRVQGQQNIAGRVLSNPVSGQPVTASSSERAISQVPSAKSQMIFDTIEKQRTRYGLQEEEKKNWEPPMHRDIEDIAGEAGQETFTYPPA